VRSAVLHPVMLPVLLGLAWNLTGLPLPPPVDEALRVLGSAVVPVCLVLIGLNLAGVSVPSLALYNFIKFDQSFPDGEAVIILDVGADNTDLVVYQADQLWMRSLPVSGNDITQVFAKKFRVSIPEAETLKRQVGDSRQAEKIIKVIESGLTELVSEVNRSLGFYRTQNANATLDNLVISGNTFRLPGLPEYMAEKLRLTINILEDLDKIQVASGLDRSHFMQDLQSLGVAMGLALQATGVARANVNLMPSGLQTERILASQRWAAAAIIGLLGATLYADYAIASSAAETRPPPEDSATAIVSPRAASLSPTRIPSANSRVMSNIG
jgi:type IV pilus assembly protein PilM